MRQLGRGFGRNLPDLLHPHHLIFSLDPVHRFHTFENSLRSAERLEALCRAHTFLHEAMILLKSQDEVFDAPQLAGI